MSEETLFMQAHCIKCGNCCRAFDKFKITKKELKQIAKYRTTTWQILIKQLNTRMVGQTCYINQPCPFLKDNLCSIYAVRPWNCKAFPVHAIIEDKTRLDSELGFECAVVEATKRIMKEMVQ